jgi:hypothetical protein
MDSVGVKFPTIQLGDLVGSFVQHQNMEGVTIERKESEARVSATRRSHDLPKHPLIDGEIADKLLPRDFPDACAVLLDAPIELTLEGIRRCGIFSNRRQGAERDGGRNLDFQLPRDCPEVLAEPFRRRLSRKALSDSKEPPSRL